MTARARLVYAVVLLAACKPERMKERDQLEQSVSWLATVQVLSHAWAENRVPTAYAERTLDEARAQLAIAKQDSAAALVARVRDVVRQRDRTAIAKTIADLERPRRELMQRAATMKQAR